MIVHVLTHAGTDKTPLVKQLEDHKVPLVDADTLAKSIGKELVSKMPDSPTPTLYKKN